MPILYLQEMKWRNKKMDGIIFDLDGTLWDSREVVAIAWNRAIKEQSDLNMTVDVPLLSTLFGKSMKEISEQLFPMLPEAERTNLAIACYEYENELLETEPGSFILSG
jgi:phosphoglycolate phosphatase